MEIESNINDKEKITYSEVGGEGEKGETNEKDNHK